jgi:hypothetical protein
MCERFLDLNKHNKICRTIIVPHVLINILFDGESRTLHGLPRGPDNMSSLYNGIL